MLLHAVPVESSLLAPAAKGPVPKPGDLGPKSPNRVPVAWNGMIRIVPPQYRPKPKPLGHEALMHAIPEFCLDRLKFSGKPLLDGDPTDHELPVPIDGRRSFEFLVLSFELRHSTLSTQNSTLKTQKGAEDDANPRPYG